MSIKARLKEKGWFLTPAEREARIQAEREKSWDDKRARQAAAFERQEKLWDENKPKVWLVHETPDKAARFSFVKSPSGYELAWTVMIEWDGDRWWGSNWSTEVPRIAPFGYESDAGYPNDDLEVFLGPFSGFRKMAGHIPDNTLPLSRTDAEPVLRRMADWVYENRRNRNLLRGLRNIQ